MRHRRILASLSVACALLATALASTPALAQAPAQASKLLDRLNDPWQRVQEQNKSWKPLLTAILDVTEPPIEVGERFDFTTIWPGMDKWKEMAAWAEKNNAVTKAVLDNQSKLAFAMPYGEEKVDAQFRTKHYTINVSIEGEEKSVTFGYLKAVSLLNAYVVTEMYRLAEAGKFDEAFALGLGHLRILRQLADQTMREEKLFAMTALSDALSVHRDILYTYVDKISADLLQKLGTKEYPFLKPADNEKFRRIEMPEGDRYFADAILSQCFDDNGQPNGDLFKEVFAALQAANAPMTRFGAAKRWQRIAEVHGSLEASQKKLNDVYDDWWRRWRMRPYDPIQSVPSELSRINKVRYAAIALSVQDLEDVFNARRRLIAEYDGTVMSVGLAGYHQAFGKWPDDREKAYTNFFPKRFDFDAYDKNGGRFLYRYLGSEKKPVETVWGRVMVDGGVLYARNDDHEDDGFKNYEAGGKAGDYILWPPIRVLARQQLGVK